MSTVYNPNTPPIKGSAFTFRTALTDQSDTDTFKSGPTLAAGDAKVDKDGAGLNNLATLPTASGKVVTVALNSTEMNANVVTVVFSDASGSEWQDQMIELFTVAAATVSDGTLVTLAANALTSTAVSAGAVAELAAGTWAYSTGRTLTQAASSGTDSLGSGSISRRRGDSWTITITGLTLAGYTSVWFSMKTADTLTDAASTLQVKTTDGLLYLNGAAATAAQGSISVNTTAGSITVSVDEAATKEIAPATYVYDVQTLISGATNTPDAGIFTVTADVTRAVS